MKIKERKLIGSLTGEVSQRELKNRQIARRAAGEGIVLLKNEHVLPLNASEPIALLGSGAGRMVKGGTGSGDVYEREVVSVLQGVKDAGITVTSEDWVIDYDRRYVTARMEWKEEIQKKAKSISNDPMDFFFAYTSTTFRLPAGRPIGRGDVGEAKTAVYIISRVAGEDADRYAEAGDYELTESEKADLGTLCTMCENVVVLINCGAQMDLNDILCYPQVKALAYVAQLGMEGGNAVADVLLGKVNPSGKLTDTWTKRYKDFPNADSFSYRSGSTEKEYYQEDIYVGYRYFEAFSVETAYPFGYGLSYTTFQVTGKDIDADGTFITVKIQVRNTGKVAGREVVQVYASCPQSGLPKEWKRLCAFAKTKLLQPDEVQNLTICFPVKGLASFDEQVGAWVTERGKYAIWCGNSSRDVSLMGVLEAPDTTMLEQTAHICPLVEPLEVLTRPLPEAEVFEKAWVRQAEELGLKSVLLKPRQEIVGTSPYTLDVIVEDLVDQLNEDELVRLSIGNFGGGESSVLGNAGVLVPGSAGETTGNLVKYNIPGVPMADGPAGLRILKKYDVDRTTGEIILPDFIGSLEGGFFAEEKIRENVDTYYRYCTSFPVGILLAQTWDADLVEECGRAIAEELSEMGVAWWLAPGMNIHRNPLCGRNFEYYSEDPVVSGVMAAAMTRGVQSAPGVGTTIKHFACNNQEENRMGSDSIVTERALREIYLRGFEIAIKTAQPMAMMTSYNLINGIHAANSYDLCTQVARREWGFQGIIMTDWTTTLGGGSVPYQCITAGNDLIMPGAQSDYDDILRALRDGELTLEELKNCAKRLLRVILQTNVYEDCVSYSTQFSCMKKYIGVSE